MRSSSRRERSCEPSGTTSRSSAAPRLPLLVLLLAWAAGASETTGIDAAVWTAIVSLVVFELLAGLRAGSTPREFALEGGVGVLMGLAIFALKSLAH